LGRALLAARALLDWRLPIVGIGRTIEMGFIVVDHSPSPLIVKQERATVPGDARFPAAELGAWARKIRIKTGAYASSQSA